MDIFVFVVISIITNITVTKHTKHEYIHTVNIFQINLLC